MVRASAGQDEDCGADGVFCFGLPDPRLTEIENPDGDPPYRYVLEPLVEWQLPVPLYQGDEELGIREIDVFDEHGEPVIRLRYDPATDNVSVEEAATPTATATQTATATFTSTATATFMPSPTATITPSPTATPETDLVPLLYSVQVNGGYSPGLASDWTGDSALSMRLTLFLIEATLPDGEPLTAEVIVERLQEEIISLQYGVDSYEVVDDRSFAVTFTVPGFVDRYMFRLTSIFFEVIQMFR
jgi:hypothetical protein